MLRTLRLRPPNSERPSDPSFRFYVCFIIPCPLRRGIFFAALAYFALAGLRGGTFFIFSFFHFRLRRNLLSFRAEWQRHQSEHARLILVNYICQ